MKVDEGITQNRVLNPWTEMMACLMAATMLATGVCLAEGFSFAVSAPIITLPATGTLFIMRRWKIANDAIKRANKAPVNYLSKSVFLLFVFCFIAMIFAPIIGAPFGVDAIDSDIMIRDARDLQLKIETARDEIDKIQRLMDERYDSARDIK